MQYYANKYVRISDITAYLLCPRLVYFRRRRTSFAHSPEAVRAAIFKEISRSLAGAMTADDSEAELRSRIEIACDDAATVYGLSVDDTAEEALSLTRDILEGLKTESARIGRDRLMTILDPHDRPQTIYSDRLRISGNVDRVVLLDGARCPVVISAFRPPENGIFAADRIRLAACAMLMEEKYDGTADHGVVEYVCGWRIRETEIRKSDRMAALSARNRIAQMGSSMPDARRGRRCTACQFLESCDVRPSFPASLFRPMLLNDTYRGRNETNK